MKENLAGRLAGMFLESKLTPLIMAAALGLGVWTLSTMPSEEEPQIIVPLADLYLPMPGATPDEVENRALTPLENAIRIAVTIAVYIPAGFCLNGSIVIVTVIRKGGNILS